MKQKHVEFLRQARLMITEVVIPVGMIAAMVWPKRIEIKEKTTDELKAFREKRMIRKLSNPIFKKGER